MPLTCGKRFRLNLRPSVEETTDVTHDLQKMGGNKENQGSGLY